MADGRMLKRNISDSRRLAELKTDSARLLWTWIIPYLDVEGRFFASPDMVKGKVVPRLQSFTTQKINEYLADMARIGLIVVYEVDGEKYLQFRRFDDFQSLRKDKEGKPLPGPDEGVVLLDNSGSSTGAVPENSPLREEKRREEKLREGKGREGAPDKPPPPQKVKHLDSVFLSADEYLKLQEAIGQKNLEVGIQQLDYSITVKGGKYRDHYKTILNWHGRGFLNGNGTHAGAGKAPPKAGTAAHYGDGQPFPCDGEY